jgi:iron-sulfur cluster repair protein YtfE (RIC family)
MDTGEIAGSVMDFMGEDHDRLDRLFERFRVLKNVDTRKAGSLFSDFKAGLQRHITWEEEILFPLFEAKTGMRDTGPTAVMRMEHGQIKSFLERIHIKIAAGQTCGLDALEKGLLEVLSAHNEKEENVLYPWIDDSLGGIEREDVLTRMKSQSAP